MATPIMPAPPTTPHPFYMNMARKRQMLMDRKPTAPPPVVPGPLPPLPIPGQPPLPMPGAGAGGGMAGIVGSNAGTFTGLPATNAAGGMLPPLGGGPLDGGIAGGMRPQKPPIAQPPMDGGIAGGMRQPMPPVPGNAPGPVSPAIPKAPPVMDTGGNMGVDDATLAAEKKKGQQSFFKRRQPPVPTMPTEQPVSNGY